MTISGIVKSNLGRGRKLGYPTANIDLAEPIEEGIYLSLANDKPALAFIGAAETFGEKDKKAEVYILDFNEDLYGKKITIELLKKIRDNQKFPSEEALVDQMKKDEQIARDFFKEYNATN